MRIPASSAAGMISDSFASVKSGESFTMSGLSGAGPAVAPPGLAAPPRDARPGGGQSDEGGGEALEPGFRDPVAVDEPRTRRAPNAHQVWLRMAWTRLHRDGLGGDGSEAEAHHAPEDPRIVVHRRPDQRVGQPRATERDGEPRVVEAEGGEPIP